MVKILKNKVLLAVGHEELENFIEAQLNNEFLFIGNATYKEAIIRAVGQKNPHIIVIRETLAGSEDILSIIYELRTRYSDLRIIFVAGDRDAGDEFLMELVSYGIYDILYGTTIQANMIVSLIRKANTYAEVKEFHPGPQLSLGSNKDNDFRVKAIKEKEIQRVAKKEEVSEDIEIEDTCLDEEVQDEPVKSTFIEKVKTKNVEFKEVKEKKENKEDKEEKKEIFKSARKKEVKTEEAGVENSPGKVFANIGEKRLSKEKIITFIGGKNGVGTSSIAFSSAALLASQGKKVIYIELDDEKPSTSYIYELGHISKGIDNCLNQINKGNYKAINDSIIKTADLKNKENYLSGYKKLPKTLDFLFFSKSYIADLAKQTDLSKFKELFLYIKYQLGYDYVFIDIGLPLSSIAVQDSIVYSDLVVSVISQDIASIGYHLFDLDVLEKKGFFIKDKSYYVVNKYIDCKFGLKKIKEWINTDKVFSVSVHSKGFIESNYNGVPFVLSGGRNPFNKEIGNIVSCFMN